MQNFIKTSESTTVNNYPYGRLQCKMVKSLDFKPGKGFRVSSQTTNPKTGRVNNPKKSTYSPIIVLYVDENNHTKSIRFELFSEKNTLTAAKFVYENFELFTPEQIEHIYIKLLGSLKMTFAAKMTYCNSKFEDLKPLLDGAIKQLVKGMKNGSNEFNINIDLDALKATEEEGFSPFKVTRSVNITDMIKKKPAAKVPVKKENTLLSVYGIGK